MAPPVPPTPATPRRRPLPPHVTASGAHPPPFALPGGHFAAAIAWLLLGSAGLVAVAPTLAQGNTFDPRVFAVTHAFTLGVVTTSIFGALYQFFPVTLGAAAKSVRVGMAGLWTLVAGTALIVLGFWTWTAWLQAAGWCVLFAAVGVVSWNLLPQRRRATQGHVIGRYVSAGHAAFGFAMLLAAARIGETAGWWTVDRLGMIAAHLHLAAFGFAGLTAVGVGSRMLPMFLSSGAPLEWPLRWIGPVAGAGLVLFGVGQPLHVAPLSAAGAALLFAAGALYLVLVWSYFRTRAAPRLDHGLLHIATSFGFLALTLLVGAALATSLVPSIPRWWAAYTLLGVGGWLTLFILGVLYRILPFLSWLHLFGPRATAAGRPPMPVQSLSRPAWARLSLALLAPGIALLAFAVGFGRVPLARAGAGLLFLGVLVQLAHWLRLVVLYQRLDIHAPTREAA
ncbi:MAG TPA: hypothetical protein VFS40_02360 [Gemmatimonadales bacterium]|nr:hypothetical protein [Gemmatimonadales bacterium]